MTKRIGESGNIFFTLFGAVALVGVIGVATSNLMRGPVGTVMKLNQQAKAESQLQIARKMSALEAAQQATNDCEPDTYLEPLPPDVSGACATLGLAGGGCLPSTVGASKNDPWGTLVGYCAWDHGPTIGTCDPNLLDGTNASTETVIAVISAGPDRTFQSTCGNDPAYVTSGGDDLVMEWTYDDAVQGAGGLWALKSSDPNTAEILNNKNIEVGGNASFQSGAQFARDVSFGAGSYLDLSAGSLLNLPDHNELIVCNAANNEALRVDSSIGLVLQICDDGVGWVDIGGSGSASSVAGSDGDVQFNSGNTLYAVTNFNYDVVNDRLRVGGGAVADDTLEVTGTADISGNLEAARMNIVSGGTAGTVGLSFNSAGSLGVYGSGSTVGISVGGTTRLSATTTGAGVNGNFNVSGDASVGGTLGVGGKTTISDDLDVTGAFDVQGDITDSGGAVTVNDDLVVNQSLQVGTSFAAENFEIDTIGSGEGMYQYSSGTGDGLSLQTSGVERMTIDGTGNTRFTSDVGIGLSGDPTTGLDIGSLLRLRSDPGYVAGTACTLDGSITYTSGDELLICSNITGNWETIGTSGGGGGGGGGIWERLTGVIRLKPGDFNDADDFVVGSLQLNDEGSGNQDQRMFFENATGAFRAGVADGTQWDTRGNYSTAFGLNSQATADSTFAVGNDAQARATDALALGRDVTVAAGALNSMAIGLGIAAGADPQVTGTESLGIFMQNQSGVTFAANNTMGLFGGKLLIDPNEPATELATSLSLTVDVEGSVGAINFCSEDGTFCFTAEDVSTGATGAPGNDREMIFNSAGALATDTNFVFTSAGRLGIGTAAPTTELTITDIDGDSVASIRLQPTGSDHADITLNRGTVSNYGRVRFQTAGTDAWALGVPDVDVPWTTTGQQFFIGRTSAVDPAFIIENGTYNVGVGALTPQTLLDVSGTIKMSYGGEACDVNRQGAIHFDSVGEDFYVCQDGTNWQRIITTGGGAGTPAGGSDREVQFNSGGNLEGNPNFVFTSTGNFGLGLSNPDDVLDVVGSAQITGASVLGSSLDVTGQVNFSSGLNVTSATDLASTLDVTGATTLNNTLTVVGANATTLGGSLDATGQVDFSSGLNVALATGLASTLDVTGATTLNGLLTTTADSNLGGLVTFTSSGAVLLPVGDTSAQPSVPQNGMIRYNTDNDKFEAYQGGIWQDILTSAVSGGAAAPDRGVQFNSGGDFTADANFVFTSAGRLGIGTAAPSQKLTVIDGDIFINRTAGAAGLLAWGAGNTSEYSYLQLGESGTGHYWTMDHSEFYPNALRFGYDGAGLMALSSSGLLGIGTMTPTHNLHVDRNADSTVNSAVTNMNAGANARAQLRVVTDGGQTLLSQRSIAGGDLATLYNTNAGGLYIVSENATNSLLAFQTGATAATRMTIDDNGLVTFTSSGAVLLPVGNTSQQPSSPQNGMIRYNTDNGMFEAFQAGSWQDILTGAAATSLAGLTDTNISSLLDGQFIRYDSAASEWVNVTVSVSDLAGNAGLDREIFFNSGGALGTDTNFVFTSAGNFGLGLANPDDVFDVVGSAQITGATVLGSSLDVTGQVNFSSGLNVTSATDLASTLNVTGATTLDGLLTTTADSNLGGLVTFTSSGAVLLPVGDTSAQPSVPQNGMIRYNTDNDKFEAYQGGIWQDILTSAVSGGAAAPDRGVQFNSGGDFTADANFVFTSAGRLGIGTAAPSQKLTVIDGDIFINRTAGAAGLLAWGAGNTSEYSYLQLGESGTGHYWTMDHSEFYPNALRFGYDGAGLMALSSSGLLGIGTMTPTHNLHVDRNADSTVNSAVTNMNAGANARAQLRVVTDGGQTLLSQRSIAGGDLATLYNTNAGGLYIVSENATNSLLAFQTGATAATRMTIDDNGLVTFTSSGAVLLPVGNTSQQPSSPQNGMIRYNTDNGMFEAFQAGSWQDILTGAAATSLAGLTDTNISSLLDGQFIRYDSAASEWVNVTVSVSDLAGNAGLDREIFFNSGGALGTDTNFVFTSAGNFGLGLANPDDVFDVVGSAQITGATVLGSSLDVTGQVNFSSGLNVTSATDLASTLNVTGATTLDGLLTTTADSNLGGLVTFTSSGAVLLPVGNTGQQPSSAQNGMIRYNTDNGMFEAFQAGSWQDILTGAAATSLAGLTDTNISSLLDGQFIRYDSAASEWVNVTVSVSDLAGNAGLDREIFFNSGGALGTDTNFVFTSAGRLGLGTGVPQNALHMVELNNPTIRLNETADQNKYATMYQNSSQFVMRMTTDTGGAQVDFSPIPEDGTSPALFRVLRDTNTSGLAEMRIYRGDGTASVNSVLSGNGDSYLNNLGGSVAIGKGLPRTRLDVAGTIKMSYGGEACDANRQGAIHFDSVGEDFYVCQDGANWQRIITTGGGAGTPAGGADREIQFNSGGNLEGAPNFVFTSSGFFGIGTPTPSYDLHVENNQNAATYNTVVNYDAGAAASANFVASADGGYSALVQSSVAGGDVGILYNNTTAGLVIASENATSSNLAFQTGATATDRMVIDHDGLVTFTSSGAVLLPVGDTSQQPSVPQNGMIRYNTDNGMFEAYQAGAWQDILTGAAATSLAGLTDTNITSLLDGQFIRYDSAAGDWVNVTVSVSDLAGNAGLDREIFFNSGGALGTDTNFVFTSAGSFGLGTTTPNLLGTATRALTVSATGANESAVLELQGNGIVNANSTGITFFNGAAPIGSITSRVKGTTSSGALSFSTIYDGTVTEVLRLSELGAMGVGTIAPQTQLDVDGTLRIAYSGEACDVNREGAIRYDSGANTFSFCALTANDWETVSLGSGTLAALSDTTIAVPSNGQILYYSGSGWVNNALAINDLSDAVTSYSSGSMYLGQGAGATMASGNITDNTFVGYNAGNLTNGSRQITIFGSGAGSLGSVGNFNTLIGFNAGRDGPGINNVMIGDSAGLNASGASNVLIGSSVATRTTSGSQSVIIGNDAGGSTSGSNGARSNNTIIGYRAGSNLAPNADNNTFFGHRAGVNTTTGTNNLLIGYGIDAPFATASDYINIGNVVYGSAGTGELFFGSAATGGAVRLPSGATAYRPGTLAGTTAENGMIRYNETSGKFEGYQGGSWQDILTGAIAGGAAAPDRGIQFNSGNSFAADANFVYTSAGRLGIGVTNPTRDVVISGDEGLTVQGDTISGRLYIGGYSDGGSYAFMNLDDYTNGRTWSMSHAVSDNGLGISYYDGSSSDVMRFTSAGSVGVGTITPQTQLEIEGTIKIAYGGETCNVNTEGAIRYDSAANTFSFCALTANDWETVSLGAGTLAALSDTNIAAPSNGHVLYYSGSDWVNNALAINDLSDGAADYTSGNLFLGQASVDASVTGSDNLVIGVDTTGALMASADRNTVLGTRTARRLSTGDDNVVMGHLAGDNVTGGYRNVAIGTYSGQQMGYQNTYLGERAGRDGTGNNNTMIGRAAGSNVTSGDNNVILGNQLETTIFASGSNNILLGAEIDTPQAATSDYLNLGNIFYGSMGTGELYIGSNGALRMPVGDDAQRPGTVGGTTAANGMIRYNSASDRFEGYQAGAWQDILTGAIAGGAAAPDRGIQFNSGNSFAADANFTYTSVGRLGLGTATPQQQFHLVGSTANGDGLATIENTNLDGEFLNMVNGNGMPIMRFLQSSTGQPRLLVNDNAYEKFIDLQLTTQDSILYIDNNNTTAGDNDAILSMDATSTGETEIEFLFDGVENWKIESGDSTSYDFVITNPSAAATLRLQSAGNMGVGVLAPNTRLDVDGTLKIAYGNEACNAAREGGIHYNSGDDNFYVCQTAGSWSVLATGSPNAAAPDRGIQFNSGNSFAAASTLQYTSMGALNIGTFASASVLDEQNFGINKYGLRIVGQDLASAPSDMLLSTYTNSATTKSDLDFFKARGTEAVPADVQLGDEIGLMRWYGFRNGNYRDGGAIAGVVSNLGGSTINTDISLRAGGGSSGREVMRISRLDRVGIMTSTPQLMLDVNGAIMFASSNGTACDASREGAMQYGSGGTKIFEVCADTANGWEQLALGGTVSGALNDLSDVNTTGFADGNVLLYSAGASSWVPGTAAVVAAFTDLTDTPANYTAQAGKFARVNSGETAIEFTDEIIESVTGAAAPITFDLNDLGDVSASATGGQFLSYDSASGVWVAASISSNNVTAAGSDSQIQYNSNGAFAASSNFVYTSTGRLGLGRANPVSVFDVAGDIRFSSSSLACNSTAHEGAMQFGSGGSNIFEVCANSGTGWEQLALGGAVAGALNDLSDVTTTGVTAGDVLYYSGGAWITNTLTFAELSDTPATYTGQAGRFAVVNSGETAIAFTDTIIESVTGEPLPNTINLNSLGDVTVGGATDAQVLTYNSATGFWIAGTVSGSSVSASGSDTQIQFNSGGTFGANANFVYTGAGYLGLGTASPVAMLDVAGEIKFASSSLACNSTTHEGAMQFGSGGSNIFEVCADSVTGWEQLALGGTVSGGLGDLSDVTITSVVDGEFLSYSSGAWVNVASPSLWTDSGAGYIEYSSTLGGVKIASITGAAAPVGATKSVVLSASDLSAAGVGRELQFNSGGNFDADANLVYTATGLLGLGVASPVAKLDVLGEIKFASSSLACNSATHEGAMQFGSGGSNIFEVCADSVSGWEQLALGGTVSGGFTDLSDTPASYVGQAGRFAVVNSGETAINFTDTIIESVTGQPAPNRLNLSDLGDVNVSGVLDTQFLTYDSATGEWVAGDIGYISSSNVSAYGNNTEIQYNSNGSFYSDTNFVYSAGRLGVGNASPSVEVDVTGDIKLSGNLQLGQFAGNAPTYISSGYFALNNLTDVDTAGFADGNVLLYSAGASGWVSGGVSTSSLTAAGSDTQLQFNSGGAFGASSSLVFNYGSGFLGVGTASPTAEVDVTGDVKISNNLILSPISGLSAPTYISAGYFPLASLTDVDVTGVANGNVLLYSAGASGWVAGASGGGGTLNDLTDVDTTGFADGNVLLYSAGASGWVPSALSYVSAGTGGIFGQLQYAGTANCYWDHASGSWLSYTTATGACPAASVSGAASAPTEGKIPAIRVASLPAGDYAVTAHTQFFQTSTGGCRYRITDGTTSSGLAMSDGSGGGDNSMLTGYFSFGSDQTNKTFYIEGIRAFSPGNCRVAADEVSIDFTMTIIALNDGPTSGGGGGGAINDLSDATTDYTTDFNFFMGSGAGSNIASGGQYNMAIGQNALSTITTGDNNVAIGYDTLTAIVTNDSGNVAVGKNAGRLYNMGDGAIPSVFIGNSAGEQTSYWANAGLVAIGSNALAFPGGTYSVNGTTAIGAAALENSGQNNSAVDNTAIGSGAGIYQRAGDNNVYLGAGAASGATTSYNHTGDNNVIIGQDAATDLDGVNSNNVIIGQGAAATLDAGSNNLLLGYGIDVPSSTASNYMSIADVIYASGIYNATTHVGINNATPNVELDVTGDIEYTGTLTDVSDRRLKTDITPLNTDEMMAKLAQVNTYSFRMKDDPKGVIEFGVMAQELEKQFPELVKTAKDEMGTKSVNYVGLIAPLIEASKKLKSENDTLRAELAEMKTAQAQFEADIMQQVNGLKAHTGYGISKAQMGLWMLVIMFGSLSLWFVIGGMVRNRQNKQR